jgi:hypothetical protein
VPVTTPVFLIAGCQAPKSLKLLTVDHALAAGALIVTSSCADNISNEYIIVGVSR